MELENESQRMEQKEGVEYKVKAVVQIDYPLTVESIFIKPTQLLRNHTYI